MGALAPFVPFLHQRAEAAPGGFPRRVLLVFTGNGSVPSEYWPTGGETTFTFRPGSITEPLAPLRSKLIFPKGITRIRSGPGGHESATVCCWTASSRNPGEPYGGYAKHPSVDQMLAKALPKETVFPSLEFGVQHDGGRANPRILTVMSYAGNDMPVQPESNPYRMFDKLMLGSGGRAGGLAQADLDRVRARRQSVIDLVREQMRTLSRRIDREDRIKLDQHVEGISAIEKRLQTPTGAAPTMCGAPPMKAGIDLRANESFPELLALQSSLAVAALACDRTRVASLQWSGAYSMVRHTWVNVSTAHHTLSHSTSAQATREMAAIERWFMGRLAELLQQMDAVREGDGSLLDNTMLIYANELTDGAAHSVSPPITLVAGSGGRKLRTGRLLELPGYDFSQLLVTACHVAGAAGINKIGDLGKEGDIPALWA